ncbi:MAG: hypothetical protein P8J89_10250, partial [Phycisphaerales bacterium]|nr:hypothetical protein [Phycisphaerales bacterium]
MSVLSSGDRMSSCLYATIDSGHGYHQLMDNDSDSIYDSLWKLLEEGSSNRRHAFHTPVLATRMSSGDPDLRTVVLRRVDPRLRMVCCHTDSRSPKVQ